MESKERRIEIFEDTEKRIKDNRVLTESVEDTIRQTMFYDILEPDYTPRYLSLIHI